MIIRKKIMLAMLGGCVSLALGGCGDDSGSSGGNGLAGLGATTAADDVALDGDTADQSSPGGDDGFGTGTTTTGLATSPARSIDISYPNTEAIINEGAGVYSKRGSVTVRDNEGNFVPDGTRVYLNVVDSILAQGTISSGDGVDGAVLTAAAPLLGDGTTPTFFDQAYVQRNSAFRFVEPGDHVLLLGADEQDKNRVISGGDGSVTANTLTVTTPYINTLPDTIYPANSTDYVVAASMLGAGIVGKDGDEDVNGYTVTKNGVAEFKIAYPADLNSIHSGCLGVDDKRSLPYGSARVFVVAAAGEDAVTIDESACFDSISPWKLSSNKEKLGTFGGKLEFSLVDGGDEIELGYVLIKSDVDYETKIEDSMEVAVDFYEPPLLLTLSGSDAIRTNHFGEAMAEVSVVRGQPGDKATITFFAAGDSAANKLTYTISIPKPPEADTTASP